MYTMKKILVIICILFSSALFAQENGYIYIESQNNLPSSVLIDGKVATINKGFDYVIIPKVAPGNHTIALKFKGGKLDDKSINVEVKSLIGTIINLATDINVPDKIAYKGIEKPIVAKTNTIKETVNKEYGKSNVVAKITPKIVKRIEPSIDKKQAEIEELDLSTENETNNIYTNVAVAPQSKLAKKQAAEIQKRELAAQKAKELRNAKINPIVKNKILPISISENSSQPVAQKLNSKQVGKNLDKIIGETKSVVQNNNTTSSKKIVEVPQVETTNADLITSEIVKKELAKEEAAALAAIKAKAAEKQRLIDLEIAKNKEKAKLQLASDIKATQELEAEEAIAKSILKSNAEQKQKLIAMQNSNMQKAKEQEAADLLKKESLKIELQREEALAKINLQKKAIEKQKQLDIELAKKKQIELERQATLEKAKQEAIALAKLEAQELAKQEALAKFILKNNEEAIQKQILFAMKAKDIEKAKHNIGNEKSKGGNDSNPVSTTKVYTNDLNSEIIDALNVDAIPEIAAIINSDENLTDVIETTAPVNETPKPKRIKNENCTRLTTEAELVDLFQKLEAKADDDARIVLIKKVIAKNKNCYTCKDIEQLSQAFLSQTTKYDFVRQLFPYLQDAQNYKLIENAFKYESYKQKIRMEFGGEL
jgi:hypothetical protein